LIINRLKFHSHLTVRLLGDELADRGSNDYFTLKILEKLAKSEVSVEILLSNHSIEFIQAYETNEKFVRQIMSEAHTHSMQNMQRFIDKQLVSRKDIMKMIQETYQPALKAIAYSLNEKNKEITIYSHAPIGFSVIEQLAIKLQVEYKDATCRELAESIDRINKKYQEQVKQGAVHRLYTSKNMGKGYEGKTLNSNQAAFEFIMWNRSYRSLDRPTKHFDYSLCFVHGHHPIDPEANKNHIYNLDDKLGKENRYNQGEYTVLYSDAEIAPKSESIFSYLYSFLGGTTIKEEPVPQVSPRPNSFTK
jgi:hypothetical protein